MLPKVTSWPPRNGDSFASARARSWIALNASSFRRCGSRIAAHSRAAFSLPMAALLIASLIGIVVAIVLVLDQGLFRQFFLPKQNFQRHLILK